jgi:hypothetical protein
MALVAVSPMFQLLRKSAGRQGRYKSEINGTFFSFSLAIIPGKLSGTSGQHR